MTIAEHPAPRDQYRLRIADAQLDRLRLGDAVELWRLIEREREHLDLWRPAAERTREELDMAVERGVRAWDSGYQYRFCIRHLGAIVGMCGYVDVYAEPGVGELGYWLAHTSTGLGLATTSVRTLVTVGFEQLGLQRAEVSTALGNMPSRRVVERLGFQLEGVRRRCERIASGELVDHASYGVLVDEWQG